LRLRLTLLYGVLFFVAGALLLGITYGLVKQGVTGSASQRSIVFQGKLPGSAVRLDPKLAAEQRKLVEGIFYTSGAQFGGPLPAPGESVGAPAPVPGGSQAPVSGGSQAPVSGGTLSTPVRGPQGALKQVQLFTGKVSAADQRQLDAVRRQAETKIAQDRTSTLNQLLRKSGLALAIMTLVSIGLGWLMAGRALRPVRTMSNRARGISERNLHERLALAGPNDELKELGDTFDGLLARLETAFESQRRFVANASHELRTPITVERTLVEVALADPEADVESLRATCRRVLAASEQQERLIEALLTLARSQRGLEERAPLDLAEIAADVVRQVSSNGVRFESTLDAAPTSGDPALVERLMTNLIDNALHYSASDGGWARAWTGIRDGQPTLRVENSGSLIPADRVDALVEPFRRLDCDRVGHPGGLGLGLSIVSAIADAHGASLSARARAEGGLTVEVGFPRV
jgi:signal transduction histidine kinase